MLSPYLNLLARSFRVASPITWLLCCVLWGHTEQGVRAAPAVVQEPTLERQVVESPQEPGTDEQESLNIVISDEPRTIDPATVVYAPLARKFTVEFDEASLRDVVAWIRTEASVPVLLDEVDLADANILLSEPVTDRLDDQPLYLLLDRLKSISLGWYVDEEILHISTVEMAAQHLSTVSHNVGKFLDQGYHADDLIQSIIRGTNEEEWESYGGSGTLVLLGDVLFVRQSDLMHRKVHGLLKGLENPGRRTFIDDPSEHEGLRDKLSAKVSVEFEDTPLAEAINKLAEQVDADIRIDTDSFRQARIRKREPVSLKLSNQKLSSVLQALVASLRLTWTLENGTILITTQQTAEGLLKTAVFDVRDLSRNENESMSLADAITMQTSGQWDISGGLGTITFARPGVMVVRNSEKSL